MMKSFPIAVLDLVVPVAYSEEPFSDVVWQCNLWPRTTNEHFGRPESNLSQGRHQVSTSRYDIWAKNHAEKLSTWPDSQKPQACVRRPSHNEMVKWQRKRSIARTLHVMDGRGRMKR